MHRLSHEQCRACRSEWSCVPTAVGSVHERPSDGVAAVSWIRTSAWRRGFRCTELARSDRAFAVRTEAEARMRHASSVVCPGRSGRACRPPWLHAHGCLSREQCRVCRPEWSCVPSAAVARAWEAHLRDAGRGVQFQRRAVMRIAELGGCVSFARAQLRKRRPRADGRADERAGAQRGFR